MIPLTRPFLGDEESAAVAAVLHSGMLVQGAHVARFEEAVARRVERQHAVAVSSGTAALHLALEAIGIGPGDEVLVPALTWPSPAHAVRLVGATPVLVDVDPREWNVRGDAMAARRTSRTRAAIVIDQFGNPARWDEIAAALPGVALVEDAACAIGSTLAGRPCGSFGVVSCLSFHPRKVLTTGEGGMCLVDDPELAERLRVLRNHGQSAPGRFARPAGNYRLTEMAAAIGLCQLEKLGAMVDRREQLFAHYDARLVGLETQRVPEGGRSNRQTLGVVLPEGATSEDRDRALVLLRESGIEAGALSYALSRLPSVGDDTPCPVAESIVDRGFSLPLFHRMTDAEVDRVLGALEALR